MSSALTLIGDTQVLRLASRLIVGIRLQGTIGFIDPAHPHIIKPRPYLKYLAETLHRLRCDVTLIVPTNPQHDQPLFDRFHAREFPVAFRFLHDQRKFIGAGGGRGNRKRGIAPNNYTEYLRTAANAANHTGPSLDRVLFIDSEVNYRFSPVQTLVLEMYEPITRRQQRGIVAQEIGDRTEEGGGSFLQAMQDGMLRRPRGRLG